MTAITLKNIQLRYCNLVSPYTPKKGATKYTMQFYVDHKSKEYKDIKDGLEAAAMETWPTDYAARIIKAKKGQGAYSLIDPDENTDELADGRVLVKATSFADRPVPLFGEDGQPTNDPALFYPGSFVNAQLRFNAYQPKDADAPPQVKLDIVGVRFVKHGEKIASKRPSITAEDLEALGVEMDVKGNDLI